MLVALIETFFSVVASQDLDRPAHSCWAVYCQLLNSIIQISLKLAVDWSKFIEGQVHFTNLAVFGFYFGTASKDAVKWTQFIRLVV